MITMSSATWFVQTLSPGASGPVRSDDDADDAAPMPEPATRASPGLRHRSAIGNAIAKLAVLVPAPLRTALKARKETRELTRNILHLQQLSPHLIADIGGEWLDAGTFRLRVPEDSLPVAAPQVTAPPVAAPPAVAAIPPLALRATPRPAPVPHPIGATADPA